MPTLYSVRKSVVGALRGNKASSGLDFSDGMNASLQANAADFAGSNNNKVGFQQQQGPPKERGRGNVHLTRNKTERGRLQGLMQNSGSFKAGGGNNKNNSNSDSNNNNNNPKGGWVDDMEHESLGVGGGPAGGTGLIEVDGRNNSSLAGEMGFKNKFRAWMVNEGGRRMFMVVWVVLHAMVFAFGFMNYQLKDNLTQARATFGITYAIARSAAFVLHLDVAFILLPICRNFISMLRRGPLNAIIPFEKNITFHKQVAWSIVFWTTIHVVAHMVNFTLLAIKTKTGVVGFIGANFLTGPGATGWIMTLCLAVMVWYAIEKRRRRPNGGFERFWYSHHLFIIFFIGWQLHGMFCMIQPDTNPKCSWTQIGVFWKYWLVGGLIFIYERILREVRARHRTYISKVIQHPSNVVEVQIKKEKTTTRAGQYIFLNCPEISFFQWHPFTLTSAPEEDYISVHIRCQGDFTKAFAQALGCNWDRGTKGGEKSGGGEKGDTVAIAGSTGTEVSPPINKVLPRIMVDGPFGSASEDVFKFEVSVLVGAGIGVTPFASILKSIWYRVNYPQGKPTRLSKVYFFWICPNYDSFEWFQSLLMAIEEQDLENYIEIHTYLSKVKDDDITNIVVQDVGGERDAITGLRAPTHYGRPNWDRIFQSIKERHPSTDAGVFFCGPRPLGSTLHQMCNRWTSGDEDGTRFFWGKENF